MANDPRIILQEARLSADPAISTSQKGTQYMRLRFGVTPWRKNKQTGEIIHDETQWYTVTEFDARQIETYMNTLRKGSNCYIEGVLDMGMYQDKSGQMQLDYAVKFAKIRVNLPRAKAQQQQTNNYQGSYGAAPANNYGGDPYADSGNW